MFILDTSVLSAMISPKPAPLMAAWVAAQKADLLFTVAICQAEILAGLAAMPQGRRRQSLQAAARAMFAEDFENRVLPFDTAAAIAYADLIAARKLATLARMIAAVAHAHHASIVTRDPSGFDGCGVTVINPWTS